MSLKGEIFIEIKTQNKFPDERLEDCQTLADLHDAFTLRELVILTQDGLLEKWLNNNLLESQAQMLSSVRSQGGDAVLLALCNVLDIDVTKLSDYEAGQVARFVKRERVKSKHERECGKDGVIVTNQGELVETLQSEDVKKVYLYDEIFYTPKQGTYNIRWSR